MEKCKSVSKKTSAFTIVELLTVMAVIAILIGLLVPALGLVKDFAKEIQQKAQFHSIEVAVDMFVANSGYGAYPPSDDNSNPVVVPPVAEPVPYAGAQKLAEALMGWDLMGYHPKSIFRSDGGDGTNMFYGTTRQNLEEREGPFIEAEDAKVFRMGDIYTNIGSFDPDTFNFVLCDVFAKNRAGMGVINNVVYGGKKTGMPILYYRARTEHFEQTWDVPDPANGIEDDIYYYGDNEQLLLLGSPQDSTALHPIADGVGDDYQDFENMILNDAITTMRRPYKAGSYILISAGKDGLYGSGDDLMNFTKE